MHHLIKDSEFESIFEILLKIKRIHLKSKAKIRNFIEAVFYVCRSGCQWRLLPFYYGHWRSIHKRFKYWSMHGVWEKMFKAAQVQPDMEWIMIDSTIVRSHACSAGLFQEREALGRSKGGFTTKIHASTDALGNPLNFILTAGQKSDISQAKLLTKDICDTACLADKGYVSKQLFNDLVYKNCSFVIPPRKNAVNPHKYDKVLYRERHAIECFFGKIKHFRRIFSRFDKIARSYLSFLHFVGVLIWIR